MASTPTPYLTHYTGSLDAVANILANGFAYVPNRRLLIKQLLPEHDFRAREPQQFGMISLTEARPGESSQVRGDFGNFGLAVSRQWALSHNAQPVLYLDNAGPVFDAFRELFLRAYKATVAVLRFPEDGLWQVALTNRFATLGTVEWSLLLSLYDYMEPASNSHQREWRIVHPYPLSGYPTTKKEIIANVSPPKGWAKALHVVPIPARALVGFVCPRSALRALKARIPEASGIPIHAL